jgi:hypothetical protein
MFQSSYETPFFIFATLASVVATGFIDQLQVDLQLRGKCSKICAKPFFLFLPHLQVWSQLSLLPSYKCICNQERNALESILNSYLHFSHLQVCSPLRRLGPYLFCRVIFVPLIVVIYSPDAKFYSVLVVVLALFEGVNFCSPIVFIYFTM